MYVEILPGPDASMLRPATVVYPEAWRSSMRLSRCFRVVGKLSLRNIPNAESRFKYILTYSISFQDGRLRDFFPESSEDQKNCKNTLIKYTNFLKRELFDYNL